MSGEDINDEVQSGAASSNPGPQNRQSTSNQPIDYHSYPRDEPNNYPPQPNCGVHVVWTVMVKLNSPGTSTIMDSFFCDTTLTDYVADIPNSAAACYQYVYSQQALPADVEVHWRIKFDNPTAPVMRMGGYPLNKESLDGHLTSLNIGSTEDLYEMIMIAIPQMQSRAKY